MNFLPTELSDSITLGQITRRLWFCEALLDLMVDKLDKSIVLFREFLLENVIVLGPNLLNSLLAHSFGDHRHLLEGEDWFLCLTAAGACLLHVHHRFGGTWGRHGWWGALGRRAWGMRSCELASLFKPLDLISEIISNLFRGEGGLLEDRRCGARCGGFLWGAVRVVDGHAAPPLLGARWGVKWIKIKTSLESHTSHG